MPFKKSLFTSEKQGTANFHGAGDSRSDPGYGYMRLKKEGIGVWFKGRVTENFPPEEDRLAPWDIVIYPDPNSSSSNPPYKAKIVPGLAGGILPSNYDDEFDVGTGLKYVVADCTTDGERVTSVTISVESSFPSAPTSTQTQAPSSIKIATGMFEKETDKAPVAYNFFKGFIPVNMVATKLDLSGTTAKVYYNWRIG